MAKPTASGTAGVSPLRPRLAVIGSGLSGLSAGWLLRERFDVTLFERHPKAGMGAVSVDCGEGPASRVDIPARVIAPRYYPQFARLLDGLGVRLRSADHAAAYIDEQGKVFYHYGEANIGRKAVFFPKNRATVSPRGIALTIDALRLLWRARAALATRGAQLAGMTMGEYLDAEIAGARVGAAFVERVLMPSLSLVCTCDYAAVRAYPADMLLHFLASGVVFEPLRRAEKGVDDIVSRLLNGVRLSAGVAVHAIDRDGAQLRVVFADGRAEHFDHVVIATEAPQAARLLEAFPLQRALLEQVTVEYSRVVVHSDARLLPRSTLPLSPVTYRLGAGAARPEVTVDMRRAFANFESRQPVLQTWSPLRDVAARFQFKEASFTRPVVTHASREAMRRLRTLQAGDTGGLWICGAYVGDRVPVLEAAVASAMEIAARLAA